MGSRVRFVMALVAASAIARAAPGPVTIKGKGITTHDLARTLGQVSGCSVMAGGAGTFDLDIDNLYLWDVLAKLEIENNLHARAMGPTLVLDAQARPNEPSWATDWLRLGPWAVAYQAGPGGGFTFVRPGAPPADTRPSRLWIVGLAEYVVERVIIDHATVDKKSITVDTSIAHPVVRACDRATIDLVVHAPASATKLSLQGRIVVRIPSTIERRVEVPIGDDVADLAVGRLRVHVGSTPATAGNRAVRVSWDWMGEGHTLGVEIVDEKGVVSVANGRGFSSGGSMGSEDRTIAWTSGKRFAIITLPGATSTKQEIPFRFDGVSVDPPTP